jgi:hypothetical protein
MPLYSTCTSDVGTCRIVSVQELVRHDLHTRSAVWQCSFQQLAEGSTSTWRLYSRTNRAPLGLESPLFTVNVCSQNSRVIQSHYHRRQFCNSPRIGILSGRAWHFTGAIPPPPPRARLNGLLEGVSLKTTVIGQWLSENDPGRWSGRRRESPVSWPAWSPDLSPLNLFLWGYLKTKVQYSRY